MATEAQIKEQLYYGKKLYCGQCKQPCNVVGRDYGIGSYGYGAGTYSHSDVCLESECCDSEELLLESELAAEAEAVDA